MKRIPIFTNAVQQLSNMSFDVRVPMNPLDEVGTLGLELNKLSEMLERHFDQARKLQHISEQVTSALFLDEVLEKIYDTFRSVIPYGRIGVALVSDDKQRLSQYWVRSDKEVRNLKVGYSAPIQGSSLQHIMDTGRPRILNDLEAYWVDHPNSKSTRLAIDDGIRSSLTCPLIAQGKPVGVIFFSSFSKNTYDQVHQEIFIKIALQLSLLLEKARMYQELSELNQELLETKRMLFDQATHDELTGLYNRRAISGQLETIISRYRRERFPLSLAVIDIDFFKHINDKFGHQAGDTTLKAVANCLSRGVRDYNQLGRYGGEEFLIILDGEDAESAEKIAERLRLSVADSVVEFDGHSISVTISIGIAMISNVEQIDTSQFISVADHALYDAKQNGRNRVVVRHIE